MPIKTHQFSHYNTAQLLNMMDPSPQNKDARFKKHHTIDFDKIIADLWSCETCCVYPCPWNSSGDAVNGPCIILSEETVGS